MIGRPRVHHRATDSTNERAKALALAGAPHGTLVTAGEQTAGRGRQGRSWVAEAGASVLMSVVLRGLGERHALLPLAAAVGVCETAEACAGVTCAIKWPNDVWIDRRKVAGILVEGRPQEGWAVLGVGLNVRPMEFPPELRERATTLGHDDPEGVLAQLTRALDRWLAAPSGEVLSAWRERDALLGEPVRWDAGEGAAAGVDDSGALIVDTPAGRVALSAGEVHLHRPDRV
jgi:BirA family transcriptional regulator, biotin operon repressor / biotin---[acetyl-CoA-carboxylase] ligase